jgi:nicotinamide-nucleotide adenylyltransferase
MLTRGVFVGRFQPLHKGHLGAIRSILEKVDELIIIVGSSQYSHKLSNPFTAGERITMIKRALEEEGIQLSRCWIIPVPDVQLHVLWISQIMAYSPKFEVVYSNEPLTRRLFVEAAFRVEPVSFIKRKVYSATEIRKRMLNREDWEELVPRSVAHFIKEIDGVARLLDLNKTDVVT